MFSGVGGEGVVHVLRRGEEGGGGDIGCPSSWGIPPSSSSLSLHSAGEGVRRAVAITLS